MIAPDTLRATKTIVTHDNCPDGLASALILRDALPDAVVRFVQHNTPELRELAAEPGMLFCDITPPRERVEEFVAAGAIVLDHHGTQRDVVVAFGPRGVFADEKADPGASGAVLAFKHVWLQLLAGYPIDRYNTITDFAWLAGIRDTWQRDNQRWLEACAQAEALRFWPRETWLESRPAVWPDLLKIGPVLLQKHAAAVKTALAGAYRFTSAKGTRVRVFQGLDCTSDAAELADADLVVGFLYAVDSVGIPRLMFSLRGRGEFNCARLAKSLGGGGHAQAAGFQVDTIGAPYTTFGDILETFERESSQPSAPSLDGARS